jgi:hypothetical protein
MTMLLRGSKVKEIAKDVGVSAKTLVARCRVEGMAVQNSVSRLTRAQEETVRSWFEGGAETAGESR